MSASCGGERPFLDFNKMQHSKRLSAVGLMYIAVYLELIIPLGNLEVVLFSVGEGRRVSFHKRTSYSEGGESEGMWGNTYMYSITSQPNINY